MKMAGPNGPAIFIFRILGTRTREGRRVKQTVQWTVCSRRELERQRKPVSMQGTICRSIRRIPDGAPSKRLVQTDRPFLFCFV